MSNIIPFDSPGASRLIPYKEADDARRAFEAPGRESTISEMMSYYQERRSEEAKNRALTPFYVKSSNLPSLLTKYNTLGTLREEKGFKKAYDRAWQVVDKMLSFNAGMEILKRSQKRFDIDLVIARMVHAMLKDKYGGSSRFTKDDLLDLGTSLTSEEITWISVLKEIPPIIYKHHPSSTPAIVDYFYDGVEWAENTLDYIDRENPRDTFELVGLTGVRSDTIFTRFEPEMVVALQALYYGFVADTQIYERCMEELRSSALISGDKKVLEAFARRARKSLDDTFAREARERVNKFLNSLYVVEIAKEEVLEVGDVVRLFGLLERLPDFLFKKRRVAFIPSGKGVMFLEPGTLAEIEYVPFDAHVAYIAQNEIHYCSQAIDRENKVWTFIFSSIRARINAKNERERNFSTLERMARRIEKTFGIEVSLGVQKYREERTASKWMSRMDVSYTVKMHYWDLSHVFSILSDVPKHLLTGIKKIERLGHDHADEESILTGLERRGSYSRSTKTFRMHLPPLDADKRSDYSMGIDSVRYSFVIAHEVGHSVHYEQHMLWAKWCARLSKASDKFPIEKRREEFVTAYASTTPEEDFAEHFAAYIVCPTEFRRLASTYPALSLKYGFMKELFEGKEFEDRYYKSFDDISTPIDFDFDLKRKLLEEADERAAKIGRAHV